MISCVELCLVTHQQPGGGGGGGERFKTEIKCHFGDGLFQRSIGATFEGGDALVLRLALIN